MSVVERLIEAVSPQTAYRRATYRTALAEMRSVGEQMERRRYATAEKNRYRDGWRLAGIGGNAALRSDLRTLRDLSRQMVRDNPYAGPAVRSMTAALVGDGIEARAVHPNRRVAKKAQQAWRRAARSRMDGRDDLYGLQKQAIAEMIEAGECFKVWTAKKGRPNARCRLYSADQLDPSFSQALENGGKIDMGIEFDADGERVAYHFWETLPSDGLGWDRLKRVRTPADQVDHLFRADFVGQIRGVPWFHAAIGRLFDIDDLEEAIRIKKRVEACLALVRIPPDETGGEGGSAPIGRRTRGADGSINEGLKPGAILTARPGEKIEVVNPSSGGDSDAFHRSQVRAALHSVGVPYHMGTGDVSQANYSSLRAATIVFWQLLDDWIFNTIVPHLCDPSFRRVMQVAAIEMNEPKLLEVEAEWTPAPRAWVDPLKDITAQILSIRAGIESLPDALSARGKDWREAIRLQAQVDQEKDAVGVVWDTDARLVNKAGAAQAQAAASAAGDDETTKDVASLRLLDFAIRATRAHASGDEGAMAEVIAESATAHRSGDPLAAAYAHLLSTLDED